KSPMYIAFLGLTKARDLLPQPLSFKLPAKHIAE
ncbi:hypothetical protein CCACVL1_15978, partial [Corchorus capsularis]